jgi:protein-L-isoaspartate O-methyltransferase
MGTGSFAVLAIYASRVLEVRTVWTVDVIPEVARSAQAHAHGTGTPITCACGDLFNPVVGKFDIIIVTGRKRKGASLPPSLFRS